MGDSVSLKVSGLDSIDAALRDLPREVQSSILTDALHAGAEVLKQGVADKIHDRTKRTSQDLRVEVQVKESEAAGAAAVGGSTGKYGRSFVLRFLERGTKPHAEPKKPKGEQRRGKSFTRSQLLLALRSVASRKERKPMSFGGKVYSRVKHPGTKAQAPMRITVGTHGGRVIDAFARKAWDGIRDFCERRPRAV